LTLAPDAYAGLTMVLLRLLVFAPAGRDGAPSKSAPAAAPAAVSMPTASSAALTRPAPRTVAALPQSPPTRRQAPPPASEPPAWMDEAPMDEDARGSTQAASGAACARPAAEAPAAVPLQTTPLGDRWVALVTLLNQRQAVTALARELAMQAQLVAQSDGAQPLWRLRVERESLRAAALVDKLRGALADALEAPLQLEVEAGIVSDSPARREAAERERRQREAEELIHNDPMVKEMLAQFPSARIVPGSIKPH
jgi:DNA polymerase-3 subunit gamma/tau